LKGITLKGVRRRAQVYGVGGTRFRGAGCRMGWGGGGVEPATDAAAAAREDREPARNARVMRMTFIGGGHARVRTRTALESYGRPTHRRSRDCKTGSIDRA